MFDGVVFDMCISVVVVFAELIDVIAWVVIVGMLGTVFSGVFSFDFVDFNIIVVVVVVVVVVVFAFLVVLADMIIVFVGVVFGVCFVGVVFGIVVVVVVVLGCFVIFLDDGNNLVVVFKVIMFVMFVT